MSRTRKILTSVLTCLAFVFIPRVPHVKPKKKQKEKWFILAIEDLLFTLAPNWAGFLLAVFVGFYAFKTMNKIAHNALHGIADSNLKIEATQTQIGVALTAIGVTLTTISQSIKEHSEMDAKIFDSINNNLQKQVGALIRLEERTKKL